MGNDTLETVFDTKPLHAPARCFCHGCCSWDPNFGEACAFGTGYWRFTAWQASHLPLSRCVTYSLLTVHSALIHGFLLHPFQHVPALVMLGCHQVHIGAARTASIPALAKRWHWRWRTRSTARARFGTFSAAGYYRTTQHFQIIGKMGERTFHTSVEPQPLASSAWFLVLQPEIFCMSQSGAHVVFLDEAS